MGNAANTALYDWVGSPANRKGSNVWYPANPTAATVDPLAAGLALTAVIIGVSFLLPWTTSWQWRKKRQFLQMSSFFISLFIGAVILECNFGGEWQVSVIHTRVQYSAYDGQMIDSYLGLHIGLRGINVTLVGIPIQMGNETINYNDHFNWEWMQGRHSFGMYGGKISQDFREMELRGAPLPILGVADAFIPDGEYIRWGRNFRVAGYYAHIMLWLAFCAWIVTNVLFMLNVKTGSQGLIVTGWMMLMANILYAGTLSWNYNPFSIPFQDGVINPVYGWSFWLCLAVGLFCCVLGILFLVIMLFPKGARIFFGAGQIETATASVYIFKHDEKTNGDKELEMDDMDDKETKETKEIEEMEDDSSDEEVKVEPVKLQSSPKKSKEEDKGNGNGKEVEKGNGKSNVDGVKKAKKHVSISTDFENKS